MPDIEFMITDSRPIPSIDPARRGMEDMLVSWVEDGVRPYQLTIHSEQYNPNAAMEMVRLAVTEHSLIIGRTGKVSSP